jgi:hypothetical protein
MRPENPPSANRKRIRRFCFSFPNQGRVAHISLVFREMWDATDLDRQAHRMDRKLEGKSSGIPYLAKNERDMGHPSLVREREAHVSFVLGFISPRPQSDWLRKWSSHADTQGRTL